MNERIKELTVEAKCYADENSAHYLQNPHWIETFEEKFAELIVRKCLNIIDEEGSHEGGSIRSMKKIKEHFGVEE